MDVPQIQYCKSSDGVTIAYWKMGEGDTPLILTAPTSRSHIALEWQIPHVAALYERLSRSRMIIRFDPRGTGLSQRELTDEQIAHIWTGPDIAAVVDDLGLERVSALGSAVPGAAAVWLAAERPDLVDRLVLISLGDGADFDRYPQLKAVLEIARVDWKLCTQTWVRMFGGWSNEHANESAEFIRRSMTQDVFVRGLPSLYEMDLATYLPNIRARTLVMNDSRGRSGTPETARLLASGIKGARFVEYPRGPYFERAEALTIIEEFLDEGPDQSKSGQPVPSGMTAILLADIVDSTALTERLGDAGFRTKARDLDAALRGIIRDHSGTPIDGKLLGDGVLAVFTSARQAIEAALACGVAGSHAGLPLHLGLHAGDVIREEGNVYGGTVNIASRISGLSAPGEVLVSDIVRGLARTSGGVSFEDRGKRRLKGVGEPMRVWAVREAQA